MDKRTFLKHTAITAAGALIAPTLVGCGTDGKQTTAKTSTASDATTAYELPKLSHAYDAYAPIIDAKTMETHHSKHHAGYVRKLNAAIEASAKYKSLPIDRLMAEIDPADTAVRNNGGGHYNHSLYWSIITPGGKAAKGQVESWLSKKYGSMDAFKAELTKAATGRFGSGWAWLGIGGQGEPVITSTPNQDNPLMSKVTSDVIYPLIGIDVWEHAYYLKYKNERKRYVTAFFDLLDWEAIEERFLSKMG